MPTLQSSLFQDVCSVPVTLSILPTKCPPPELQMPCLPHIQCWILIPHISGRHPVYINKNVCFDWLLAFVNLAVMIWVSVIFLLPSLGLTTTLTLSWQGRSVSPNPMEEMPQESLLGLWVCQPKADAALCGSWGLHAVLTLTANGWQALAQQSHQVTTEEPRLAI